ncbi:MAG: hypothetical protein EON48_16040 [Acetobacteraceae bacterium]|nr:MAG: hypothetical protein EON48_16040 [Acetobacteraceae bacterium]
MIMRSEDEQPEALPAEKDDQLTTRRSMLRIGALGAAAVVTVRPGIAQAASSALTCSIPVPQSSQAGKWIKHNGDVVNANSPNSYAPPTSPLKGEDVKNSLKYGTTYPGYTSQKTAAYNEYIKDLTVGKQGYTCYASIQSPYRQ